MWSYRNYIKPAVPMSFRKLLFTALISAACAPVASAQDIIYKKDGTTISAKVTEVAPTKVRYKLYEDLKGPTRSILLVSVAKIKYENGKEDDMAPMQEGDILPPTAFGKNMLSVVVLAISEEGMGVGLSYERMVTRNRMISLYVPFTMCLKGYRNDNTPMEAIGSLNRETMTFKISPAIKFYTSKKNGKIRHAVGPQFTYENGTKEVTQFNTVMYAPNISVSSGYQRGNVGIIKSGILLNNSLNASLYPNLYIGIDLAFGYAFINKIQDLATKQWTDNKDNNGRLMQMNFMVGYRF